MVIPKSLLSSSLGRTGLADIDVTPELYLELKGALAKKKDVKFNDRQLDIAFSRFLQNNRGNWSMAEAKDLDRLDKLAARLVDAGEGTGQKNKRVASPAGLNAAHPKPKPMPLEDLILTGVVAATQFIGGDLGSTVLQAAIPIRDEKNTLGAAADMRGAMKIETNQVLTAIEDYGDTDEKRRNGAKLLQKTTAEKGMTPEQEDRTLVLMAHERDEGVREKLEGLHPNVTYDELFASNLSDVTERKILHVPNYMPEEYKDDFRKKRESATPTPWHLPTNFRWQNGPKPPTWVNVEDDRKELVDDFLREQQRRQS